jgi:hypothetical protein
MEQSAINPSATRPGGKLEEGSFFGSVAQNGLLLGKEVGKAGEQRDSQNECY